MVYFFLQPGFRSNFPNCLLLPAVQPLLATLEKFSFFRIVFLLFCLAARRKPGARPLTALSIPPFLLKTETEVLLIASEEPHLCKFSFCIISYR